MKRWMEAKELKEVSFEEQEIPTQKTINAPTIPKTA